MDGSAPNWQGTEPASVLERFRVVRDYTETLASALTDEDQCVQSMPDASPAKWHRAHTSWFFEQFVLTPFVPGYQVFDPNFGFLFNSYYEAVGARHPRPSRGMLTRPSTAQVAAYRRHVDAAVQSARLPDQALSIVELGLHHEQQHQELLLTDILHLFSLNPLHPAALPRWREPSGPPVRRSSLLVLVACRRLVSQVMASASITRRRATRFYWRRTRSLPGWFATASG